MSVVLYSLQCKMEGHTVLKTSVFIQKDQREFCAQISKGIASLTKMRLTVKVP